MTTPPTGHVIADGGDARLSEAVGLDPALLHRHERPEETDRVLRVGLHRLTMTEFPQVPALATAGATCDGAAELNRGFDLLPPGLASALPGKGTSK